MRIISALFSLLFLFALTAHTQSNLAKAPGIQWQRCLGGMGEDFLDDESPNIYVREQKPLIATSDGGYILGGTVRSNDGDVSGNHGGSDIWLIRIDREGKTIWKKAYGGTANEFIGGIQETADQGFVIAGSSNSNNGDVSGNHGTYDFWVFRIDKDGNLQWQKSYGGSGRDKAYSLVVAPDNSIGVVGVTHSSDGDITSSHMPNDSTDVWVVKLNSTGTLLWQKSLGGNRQEEGVSIDNTGDGGFVIGANTLSTDGDVTGNHGRNDIWVVKLNTAGTIVWKRCYGGTQDEFLGRIKKTADNGFIIAGLAESVNGDVTFQPDNAIFQTADCWILKIDASGIPVWNKCYGDAVIEETLYDITELPSGEFIASGFANLAGFSSNGLPADAMLLQITSTGTVVWMNAYGSLGGEYGHAVVKGPDDGFLMLGTTSGDNTNSTGNPGVPNHVSGVRGLSDLWLVKFGQRNKISGTVFLDQNKNGTKEGDEPLLSGVRVKSVKGSVETTSVSVNGVFINDVDSGSYITTAIAGNYYTVLPASKASSFANFNGNDVINFAVQPVGVKRDLAIAALPITTARPGFDLVYRLFYKNIGTDTIADGTVRFIKDGRIDFLSAHPAQDEIKGDTIIWNYSAFKPFDFGSIQLQLKVKAPPAVNNSDTLTSLALITPLSGDLNPNDDSAFLNQRVVGSYDPNDKTENFSGRISKREIGTNAYINYVIRFQNTGTDTAFNVTVRDTLDEKLDWSSLQMVAASHSYHLNIKSQNQLTWGFNNIQLVDSFRNEPASHGFIAYRVKPKSSLVIGDIIKNTAAIYFDYNLPVETNTQETEVVQYSINNPQVGIPTISSFTPVSAASGSTVTITGTNLTGATAVSFGGVAATSFTVNSATSISAVVGAGASGSVSVTTAGGTATLAGFTFIQAPTITSFTSTSGATGASITITGTDFTGATGVSFGNVAATSFTVNSATSITAIVGAGATGDVSVTTPGGTATLAGFTYIPAPTITSFTPTSAGTAASVTITGTNLTGATAVSFGGLTATSFTVNSSTSITAVVGTGASGNISVTTQGGTATLAGFTFTLVTAIDPVPAGSLGIRLYPNPTNGSFIIDTLKLSENWERLEIFDTDGRKKLLSFSIKNKTIATINIEHLAKGFYTAILRKKNGQSAVIKFLKL